LSEMFLSCRSPLSCNNGSFSLEALPFECLLPFGLPSCRLAIDFPRFVVPSAACLERAPYELACHDRLGSALRLSQPLSGFLAGSRFVALFHATAVPGILPSELFPHEDHVPLSRPLAPLQLSTSVPNRAAHRRSLRVSPTSTLSRGCLDPLEAMDFLFPRRGLVPGRPGLCSAKPLRFASFTYFGALFPPRDRTPNFGLPLGCWPFLSWCSSPSKRSPSTPWTLDPPGREDRARCWAA
jgi:hypothetical protein